MTFKRNVGGAERAGRIVIGLLLIVLAAFEVFSAAFEVFSGTLRIAGFAVGGILFLTGVIGWCLMNALFGISACKSRIVP